MPRISKKVWHISNTQDEIKKFIPSSRGIFGPGVYTTTTFEKIRKHYFDEKSKRSKGRVYELEVALENPLVGPGWLMADGSPYFDYLSAMISQHGGSLGGEKAIEYAQSLGHDGLIKKSTDGTEIVLPFSGDSIKILNNNVPMVDTMKKEMTEQLSLQRGLKDWKRFIESAYSQESLIGGLADGASPEDIANYHKIPLKQLTPEYEMGLEVEKEHTSDPEVAHEIVLDHLKEDPKYYSKLKAAKLQETRVDADEEYVIARSVEDMAADLLKGYENDPEVTTQEAVEELNSDAEMLKRDFAKSNAKAVHSKDLWNDGWKTAIRSGISGSAATSSVSTTVSPLKNFDEAKEIFFKTDDEKLKLLAGKLGFVGKLGAMNKRIQGINEIAPLAAAAVRTAVPVAIDRALSEGAPRRPGTIQNQIAFDPLKNPGLRGKTSGEITSKPLTISPFIRDEILARSIFGNSKDAATAALSKFAEKEEFNKDDILEVANLMDGPAGRFLKFLFLGSEDSTKPSNLVAIFKEAIKAEKDSASYKDKIESRLLAIKQLRDKIRVTKEERNALYEGKISWMRVIEKRKRLKK